MDSTKQLARRAGLLYLLMGVTAPIGLMVVPVNSSSPATRPRPRNASVPVETLLRLGMASEIFHQALAVFIVLLLYRLFRPVNEIHARQLVALGALVSVPIMFANVLNEVAALILVSGPTFLSTFDRAQLDSLAYLFIRLHARGSMSLRSSGVCGSSRSACW
jgi:hypothetical protein